MTRSGYEPDPQALDAGLEMPRRLTTSIAGAKIRGWVQAMGEYLNGLRDIIGALRDERRLATAVGKQLDQWGAVLGQDRLGFENDEYRRVLRVRLIVNRASGLPDEILKVVLGLFAPIDGGAVYRPGSIGSSDYSLEIVTDTAASPNLRAMAVQFILEATPAGVGVAVTYSAAGAGVFRFDSGPGFDQGLLASRLASEV